MVYLKHLNAKKDELKLTLILLPMERQLSFHGASAKLAVAAWRVCQNDGAPWRARKVLPYTEPMSRYRTHVHIWRCPYDLIMDSDYMWNSYPCMDSIAIYR